MKRLGYKVRVVDGGLAAGWCIHFHLTKRGANKCREACKEEGLYARVIPRSEVGNYEAADGYY
jgi:hypothetical protein